MIAKHQIPYSSLGILTSGCTSSYVYNRGWSKRLGTWLATVCRAKTLVDTTAL